MAVLHTQRLHGYASIEIEKQLRRNEDTDTAEDNVPPTLDDDLGRAMESFYDAQSKSSKLSIEFVEEVRKDLGTITPEEEALDAKNRRLITLTGTDDEEYTHQNCKVVESSNLA